MAQSGLRYRHYLFLWFEQLLVVLDALQIYGLFFNCYQSWSVPFLWRKWTQFAVWSNLDYFAATELVENISPLKTSKWGEMSGYLQYSLQFALVTLYCSAFVAIANRICTLYGSRLHAYRPYLIAIVTLVGQVMYVPICLAVFRLYHCDKGRLVVDAAILCGSSDHVVYTLFATLFTAPLYLYLPIYMYQISSRAVVYESNEDHEVRLVGWEILHMLQIDDYYMRAQLWTVAPFTRSGAFHSIYTLLLKALLLIVYVFFRFDVALQAFLFLLLYALYICMIIWTKPVFRRVPSNLILLFFCGAIFVDAIFCWMNSTNVRNGFTVASIQSLLLAVLNLLCLLGALIAIFWNMSRVDTLSPALRALDCLREGPIAADVDIWISILRKSRALYLDSYVLPLESFDIREMEHIIQVGRKSWMQAKAYGSVFELLLRESLDTLLLTHARIRPLTLRSFDHWDDAYSEQLSKLKSKETIYRMMAPRKRRIFYKLLALKNIKGERAIPKVIVSSTTHGREEKLRFKAQVMDLTDRSDRFLKV